MTGPRAQSEGPWATKLVAFAGLPGTGKSTLSHAVAQHIGAVWLRVDAAEAAMMEAGLTRSFETGLAAYITVREFASAQLELGRSVVVDAVNATEEGRAMWRSLANECRAPLFFVEVTCSDVDEHRRRVESRAPPTPPLPRPTWQEVTVMEREYEPWRDPILPIDSVTSIEENVARILEYVTS